jgi:hypothetical protein
MKTNPFNKEPAIRAASLKNVMTDLDIPDLNPSARFKFFVKDKGGKYIARSKKPGVRYELSDKPFVFYSEVGANEAKRLFKGAVLIKEESVNN